ncbi:hypothetical protein FEM03_09585 [Phragmitibacter flavus]|uniref:Methane oxygenase PmoA n=1 Tax=Phragmitibacter flavus TaxID=2576071 RepID=A0A5R8KFY8_9BACT|nr:DUF6807 family protein [Phragmitibacter flavus]TLD71151.1 hypothetical protein FEM03_09585 [Phragmitibacter flavus]
MSASNRSLIALLLTLVAAPLLAADFKLAPSSNGHLDILQDNKIVARYMHGFDPAKLTDTYKPYLHIFDPEGEAPITKGPGGDFPHHRAIFLGWNKILVNGKSYDRWHMKGGNQIHQKFTGEKASTDGATFTSTIQWEGEPGATILEESRTISVLPSTAPFYATVDLTSTLIAKAGDTVLDGDPEHAGLQYRPAQEVDRSKTSYLYPIEKANPQKDLDYPWFAQTYSYRGNDYTVIYLNHPENPKGARTSAYRDYGRFGTFYKTDIKHNETATIKVRFHISQGPMPSAEAIQNLWNAYTGKSEPTPATTLKSAAAKK